jgi:hypothetical protein
MTADLQCSAKVVVHQADQLRSVNFYGEMQPFVVVSLEPGNLASARTKSVEEGSTKPVRERTELELNTG